MNRKLMKYMFYRIRPNLKSHVYVYLKRESLKYRNKEKLVKTTLNGRSMGVVFFIAIVGTCFNWETAVVT